MLTEYDQQIRLIAADAYGQQVFIGSAPFLVAEPEMYGVLVQPGTAPPWGGIYTPPPPPPGGRGVCPPGPVFWWPSRRCTPC